MKPIIAGGNLLRAGQALAVEWFGAVRVQIGMPTSKPAILLVDDDPAMLRLLAHWLERDGYAVRCAENGREATALIAAECPDILLTDWEMPQMDGMDLCRWVRQGELPHYVYTVFLTVRNTSDDMVRGLEAGADDFLKKPVDRGELLARLRAGARIVELESRLSSLARLDPLTGLMTQRAFFDELNKEWSRSTRHALPLSCVMIDIDFFKRINDVYGHGIGDEVIRRLGRVLQESCRDTDLVSRHGGEEFCVLLPQTSEVEAALWAERVRNKIAATRVPVEEREIAVTASMGVAERLPDTSSPTNLVELADQALLVAKQSGRDRIVLHRRLLQHDEPGQLSGEGQGRLFTGVTARTAMTTIVAPLRQEDTLGQATRYFLRMRIGSAPVIDQHGQLAGILSDKDCLASMLKPGWHNFLIRDVMKHNVVCYDEETPVASIYDFLCRVSIRSVVIVSSGRPVGVITRGSLLRWASNIVRSQQLQGESITEGREDRTGPHCESPRQRIIRTSQALVAEGRRLFERVESHETELLPCVVGGASRMQELVNDLLACSRYIHDQCDEQAEFLPATEIAPAEIHWPLAPNLLQASSAEK
jgi:diguanylate cyclase (GGDEF)-like protein